VPYSPDLAEPGPLQKVGYLWFGHSYPRGNVSHLFFERLVALVEQPLVGARGYHNCNIGLCRLTHKFRPQPVFRYRGRVLYLGSSDILVPDAKAVYCAPSLILHYIRHHKYQPPECFCAAVLNCPGPGSVEYSAAIKQIASDIATGLGLC
jgi:hypothetical protein